LYHFKFDSNSTRALPDDGVDVGRILLLLELLRTASVEVVVGKGMQIKSGTFRRLFYSHSAFFSRMVFRNIARRQIRSSIVGHRSMPAILILLPVRVPAASLVH